LKAKEGTTAMQFRRSTLFLMFVVLWSSLGVFGMWGIGVFVFFVALAMSIADRAWVLSTILGLLTLIVLMLPDSFAMHEAVYEAARRIWCSNQLKQIALALHNYRQANGCFPSAYIADKNGKPMHSWRVLILPYMEEQALYERYNFNEPWDGPSNKKLLASRPHGYACPIDRDTYTRRATCTSYVAVVGSDAAWSGKKPGELTGDLSQTIMLVELSNADIQWTEPKDVSLDALLSRSPGCATVSSKHEPDSEFFNYNPPSGANVALADGSVKFLPGDLLASSKFPDMLKVGGFREAYIEANCGGGRRIHWPNCLALAVWAVSSGWLLIRAVPSRTTATNMANSIGSKACLLGRSQRCP
jgi:prepilin-type processing-associated H-X9-DG protein